MNRTHTAKAGVMLIAFLLGGDAVAAAPRPTPVPGGANQINGVTGTMSQVVFNGTLRLKAMSLKDAGPDDRARPNAPGERALVFRTIVSNGTKRETHGFFNATLADADGITVTGRPLDDGWSLEPGSAARTSYAFSVPAGFAPVRLVLVEAAVRAPRAFRITIRPGDLAAAPPAAQ